MTSYHLTATSDRLVVVTIELAAIENLGVHTTLVELRAFVADFDASGRRGREGGGSARIFTKIAFFLVSPAETGEASELISQYVVNFIIVNSDL